MGIIIGFWGTVALFAAWVWIDSRQDKGEKK